MRLVTPGTLLEPLNPAANYLMSIAEGPDSSLGLAWLDVSTGDFHLGVSSLENIEEDLSRVNPAEVNGLCWICYCRCFSHCAKHWTNMLLFMVDH